MLSKKPCEPRPWVLCKNIANGETLQQLGNTVPRLFRVRCRDYRKPMNNRSE
jgi:hypothetical protein